MLRVDDETPILLAIAENRLAAVTELLENDAILPLDEQFVGLQVRKLIAASTNTIELLAFLEVLQRCGLSHGAMIKLLPRKFNQFTNTKIKEDILAYISSHEAPEDKIRLCEEALNPYHPIGYIIDMMRPHHEWGKSRGVKDDIIKVMVAAQKQLRKKAPDSMEMRNQKSSDFTNQFGFVDLAIEKTRLSCFD